MRQSRFTSLPAMAAGLLLAASCASTPPPPPAAAQPSAAAAPSGPYGLSYETAIEVCKPAGEGKYLQRLKCADGTTPTFRREGSGGSRTTPPTDQSADEALEQMFRDEPLRPGEPDYHVIDIYEVRCGEKVTTLIMDMYHCDQPEPTQAPPGFTIDPPK